MCADARISTWLAEHIISRTHDEPNTWLAVRTTTRAARQSLDPWHVERRAYLGRMIQGYGFREKDFHLIIIFDPQ